MVASRAWLGKEENRRQLPKHRFLGLMRGLGCTFRVSALLLQRRLPEVYLALMLDITI